MIAIDIGSNSLRAIRFDCEKMKKLDEFEAIVSTAEAIESGGTILPKTVSKIEKALEELLQRFGQEPVVAVATAAFRKAKNGPLVAEYLQDRFKIDIEIIDPEREGIYASVAAETMLESLGMHGDKFLLADIGGGSTELVLKHRDDYLIESFDFGIVTLSHRYGFDQSSLKNALAKELGRIKEFLYGAYELFSKPKRFVASGGTPTTVAALKLGMDYGGYDGEKVNGCSIFPKDIDEAFKKLASLGAKERAKLVGEGREEYILTGLLLLKGLMRAAGYDEIIACDYGVREGVAISECKKNQK